MVGGCPELGSWDANAAPMLAWSEGDCWVGAMTLPPGDLSFKLVVVRSDGGQRWEDGGDRLLQVSERSMLRATCRFGDTSNTALDGPAFSSVDDEYDLQVGASRGLCLPCWPACLLPAAPCIALPPCHAAGCAFARSSAAQHA